MADHDETSSGSSVEVTGEVNDRLPIMVNGVDDVCVDGPDEVQQPHQDFDATAPRLIVSEQPQSRGFRFRYRCEGPSHGGLQGVSSQKSRKTFPAVRILNHPGPARIVVTLVTDEVLPKIHAHELVGKNCQNGICVADLRGNEHKAEFRFQNLGIMHVTKRNVKSILEQRILESMKLDGLIRLGNVNVGEQFPFTPEQKRKAQQQAADDAKSMQLSVVRLCFQAYLMDNNGQFTRLLPAVLSDCIYDSKSPHAAALKICRMDKYGGCCTGNEEVFLLCEKVQKDDISVRFTELDDDGKIIWQEFGSFGPNDVHRQFAIVFKTPAYRDRNIQRAVNVQIQLRRNSDDELSDPKSFTYYPEDPDKEGIDRKRRKLLPGMGPSYNPGDGQPDRGGGGYGPGGGDHSNGPYYSPPPSDRDGFNYGGQTGQQCQYKVEGNYETSSFEKFQISKKEQSPSAVKRGEGSVSSLPEYDLETDSCPYEDHEFPGTRVMDKLRQVLDVTKSVDAGFYSQEISTKFSIEETGSGDETKHKDRNTEQQKSFAMSSGKMQASDCLSHDMAVYKLAERTSVALQEYAISGDITVLLMVQRHLTFMGDENGDLPLHLAIINRQQAVVRQLLAVMGTIPNAIRKINAYNCLHQTPLHLCVLTQQSSVIDLLLKYGADPALVDRHGNTPAHLAAKTGDEACIRALTKYLRPGVTQEKPFPELDIFNYEGLTPMHLAAKSGNLGTLKTVCARKADINVADGKSGRTPLHYTVETGDVSLTGYLLLEAGADPNCITFDNNTPLHIACGRELEGMVALLVAAGADPDVENDDRPSDAESDSETDSESEYISYGMRPCDLACGNKKIFRMLNGEPYASLDDLQPPPDFSPPIFSTKYTNQDFFPDKPGYESGISSVFGEMCFVDYTSRAKLSRLLDLSGEASDWRALARCLGLGDFIHVWADSPSPTSELIDHLEHGSHNSLYHLRQGLEQIDRKDAVTLLDQALAARQGEMINRQHLSHGVGMHWTDSGFSDSGGHL